MCPRRLCGDVGRGEVLTNQTGRLCKASSISTCSNDQNLKMEARREISAEPSTFGGSAFKRCFRVGPASKQIQVAWTGNRTAECHSLISEYFMLYRRSNTSSRVALNHGYIVMLNEEGSNKQIWKLARLSETIQSLVRVAEKCRYQTPIGHLVMDGKHPFKLIFANFGGRV